MKILLNILILLVILATTNAQSQNDKNDTKMGLNSITFLPDSYQMDINGQTQYQKLVNLLKETDENKIYNILFIGHSGGSKSLNKLYFDLNSAEILKDASGGESAFREFELEDLRFILGWARAKEIYNKLIIDFPQAQHLMKNYKLWLQSAGTHYWKQIEDQNSVQIVIWYKDADANKPNEYTPLLNTEPRIAVGKSPNGPTARLVGNYWNRLGYNPPGKFHSEMMHGSEGKNLFTDYIKDMMNRRAYEEFKSEYSR